MTVMLVMIIVVTITAGIIMVMMNKNNDNGENNCARVCSLYEEIVPLAVMLMLMILLS
jgi:hypothetical protein